MSCVTEITTAINTSQNNNVASHELVIPASEIHGLEESVTTHKEKKEFPFHDPSPLRISDWDTEMVSSGTMYQLLPGQKGITAKNIDEIIKDGKIPLLCITAALYREIRYMVEQNPNSELAMFLTLKRLHEKKPIFLAFDFFMPGQEASSGGVSLDADDCRKYFNALKDIPYYKENGLHRHLCHLHSHARFDTFWSGIDDEQQFSRDDLGHMDDYRFYVVVNTAGNIKCSLVMYMPVLARVDAAVAISYSRPEHIEWLTRKRKAELDGIVEDALVSNIKASQGTWSLINKDKYGIGPRREFPKNTAAEAGFKSWIAQNCGTDWGDGYGNDFCIDYGTTNRTTNRTTNLAKNIPHGTSQLAELGNFIKDVMDIRSGIEHDAKYHAEYNGEYNGESIPVTKDGKSGTEEDTILRSWLVTARKSFLEKVGGGKLTAYDSKQALFLFDYAIHLLNGDDEYEELVSTPDLAKKFGESLASYMQNVAGMFCDQSVFPKLADTYEDIVDASGPTMPSFQVAELVTGADDIMDAVGPSYPKELESALLTDLQFLEDALLIEGKIGSTTVAE